MSGCQCLKRDGTPCSRLASNNGFCWQHQQCKMPIVDIQKKKYPIVSYFSLLPGDTKRQLLFLKEPKEVAALCLEPQFEESCNDAFWKEYAEAHKLPLGAETWRGVVQAAHTLNVLHVLSFFYNMHFGFTPKKRKNYTEYYNYLPSAKKEILDMIQLLHDLTGATIEVDGLEVDKIPNNGFHLYVRPTIKELEDLAAYKIPYEKVTLTGTMHNSVKTLDTIPNLELHKRYLKKYHLASFYSKPYIEIKKKTVVLSAKKKGALLTVQDVLFASRLFLYSHYRYVGAKFTIQADTPDTLTLKVNQD